MKMASKSKLSSLMGIKYLNRHQYYEDSRIGLRMISQGFENSKNLYSKDLYAHYGCVNAIEFSNDGKWLVSGGDDKRVLIWNMDKTLSGKFQPKVMKSEHNSNIFCLGFSTSLSKLYSGGNDEQVILHDAFTGETLDVFLHDEAVYGISVDPKNDNIFASACDDGRILIWDIRETSSDAFMLAGSASAFHAVMYNPVESCLIATANSREGVCLWDIRKPRACLIKYGLPLLSQSAMSVRFNSMGTHLLALRRRLPPILFEITSPLPSVEFDHPEYYNSCTMKSCCFAGENDEYVLSGSDDFKLYLWKIPNDWKSVAGKVTGINEAHMVLRGHRSIVNQVRYNKVFGILASSGVEKIIKLWSTYSLTPFEENNYVTSNDSLRKVYSHEEYINLVLESGQFMTHDYSHHSVQEDPRMMAFFDSLVQRDIEGWTSDSSETSSPADAVNPCYEVQSSDSSSWSSFSSDEENEINVQNRNVSISLPLSYSYASQQLLNNSLLRDYTGDQFSKNEIKSDSNSQENDSSLDRISQLIAKKRQEQLVKINKISKKLTRKKHRLSRRHRLLLKKTPNNVTLIPEDYGKGLNSTIKKKIKSLRKKRAKINNNLSDPSSDSDIDNDVKPNNTSVNEIIQESEVQPKKTMEPEKTLNNGVHKLDSLNNAVLHNDPPISNSAPLTEAQSSSGPSHSLVFNSKPSKFNGRNYRKRTTEDMQDD